MTRKLVFFISDMHYGRKTARWDTSRASALLSRVRQTLSDIIESERCDAIGICFLGDILDGESVFRFQASEQELVGSEQAFGAVQLFWDNLIAPLAEQVEVRLDGVPGNHAFLKGAHPKTNLDTFLYKLLAQRHHERVIPQFDTTEADTLEVKLSKMFGRGILIGHGHFLRSRNGLPFVGAQLRVLQWLQRWRKIEKSIPIVAAAFGHFHRFGCFSVSDTLVVFNGTALDHDEWSITRFGGDGDRIWTALLISERIEKLIMIPLSSGDRDKTNAGNTTDIPVPSTRTLYRRKRSQRGR